MFFPLSGTTCRALRTVVCAASLLACASIAHAYDNTHYNSNGRENAPRPSAISFSHPNYGTPTGNNLYVEAQSGCSTIGDPGSTCGTSGNRATVEEAVTYANTHSGTYNIIFGAGTYYQNRNTASSDVSGRVKNLAPESGTTLQAEGSATVVITGTSVVKNWTQSGSLWRIPSSGYTFAPGTNSNNIGTTNPMANNYEQVFVNNEPQEQFSSTATLTAGTFQIRSDGYLYLNTGGANPNTGATVEVSSAARAFRLGNSCILRGLRFTKFASDNAYGFSGPVGTGSGNLTVENCTFDWNANFGCYNTVSGGKFINNQFNCNGKQGLSITGGDSSANTLVEGNQFRWNNTEGFNAGWNAGGSKVIANACTIRDNWFDSNFGAGLWFDEAAGKISANDVYRNVISNNYTGLQYEISYQGNIAFNLIYDNSANGLWIKGSPNCKVYNNTVFNNGSIKADDGKSDSNLRISGDGSDRLRTTNTIVKNNILASIVGGTSGHLLDARYVPGSNSAAQFASGGLDSNVYYRSGSVPSNIVGWGAARPYDYYSTVGAFRSATSTAYETNGVYASNSRPDYNLPDGATLFAGSGAVGRYRPAQTAPWSVRSGGAALPASISAFYTARTAGVSNPWPGTDADKGALGAAPVSGVGGGTYRGAFQPVGGTVDLAVTSVAIVSPGPANPKTDDTVVFAATIQNQGSLPTPDGAVHGMNFIIDGQVVAYVGNSSTGSLAPGASRTLRSDATGGKNWKAERGSKTVTATVDNENSIAESNEGNNTRDLTFTVDGLQVQAVNAGGSAASPFGADSGYNGGKAANPSSATIDTSGVSGPAPQRVYQTTRYGTSGNSLAYSFEGLDAGKTYQVRLHFAELYWSAANQRKFNVSINGGSNVLSNFDIFAATGAKNKAVVKEFEATANANGQIAITFGLGSAGDPVVSGIEILR